MPKSTYLIKKYVYILAKSPDDTSKSIDTFNTCLGETLLFGVQK